MASWSAPAWSPSPRSSSRAPASWIVRARNKISDIVLPQARRRRCPPLAAGLEQKYDGISSFVTSRSEFYRVDTNLTVPVVDVDSWTLTIDGDVDQEVTFTFDELTEMDVVEHDITLTCVSNEVGGNLVGAARWLGVPLRDVLDRAGIGDTKADQILSTAVDGFTISTPLQVALDGRNALVAFGMNGEPLPREHGFPVRLVTPGLYGYVGSTKWLERLTLTTYDEHRGLLDQAEVGHRRPDQALQPGRHPAPALHHRRRPRPSSAASPGHSPTASRRSRSGSTAATGRRRSSVPSGGVEYWRQWYLPWDAESGSHQIAVRATNRDGRDPDRRPGPPRSPTAPAASRKSSSPWRERSRDPDQSVGRQHRIPVTPADSTSRIPVTHTSVRQRKAPP